MIRFEVTQESISAEVKKEPPVDMLVRDTVLLKIQGKSAYEVALQNGFEGTEEEWLESLKGEPGEKGDVGPAGPQGPQGAPGPQGEQGIQGKQGPQGIPGEKGEKGDPGTPGPQGEKGETGPTGPQGPAGADGAPGKDGQPGRDGADGAPGKDGKDGTNGKDGADGFSPSVAVSDIDGGHRVTITDKNGEKAFDVMDGKDGEGGSGGTPHWNDVQDKPVVMVGGSDTLTWDGNTEGLVVVELPYGTFYKVSDVALTKEDVYCEDGTGRPIACFVGGDIPEFYSNDELAAITQDIVQVVNGELGYDDIVYPDDIDGYPLVCYVEQAICVFEDNTKIGVFDFPEKGVYFNSRFNFLSFSLLNFNRFNAQEKIAPSHLYQPDWEQMDESAPDFVKNKPFGEMPTGGDTLYWDGNTEGLVGVENSAFGGMYYKVSDVVLTEEEAFRENDSEEPLVEVRSLLGDVLFECYDSSTISQIFNDMILEQTMGERSYSPGEAMCYLPLVICVPVDNYTAGDTTFPEKGIYFRAQDEVGSFYLRNFTRFPSTKLMDKKYLPMSDITAAVLSALPIYNGEVEEV